MATVTYFMRVNKKSKRAIHSIRVKFRHNNLYLYGKSGYYTNIDSWNPKTQRIKPKKVDKDNKDLNNNLSNLEVHLLNCWKNEINKTGIDKKWLQRKLDKYYKDESKDSTEMLLLDYIQDFIDDAPNIVDDDTGRKLSFRTIQRYKTANAKITEFVNKYFKDVELADIDLFFYKKYKQFLTVEKNLAANTIGKEIAMLKLFLNSAKPIGYFFDLKEFKKPSETSDSIYLSVEELELIYKYDFSKNKRLEKIRDLFIVGCWTGLRFSDLTSIKPIHIIDDMIHLTQFKTDFPVVIPLHDMTQEILNKYNYNLPIDISNPKFNEYIKEVCEIVELNEDVIKRITQGGVVKTDTFKKYELVTVHTARISFATNLYLDDFPTLSIMAITGHKTESSFLKYIKVSTKKHALKLLEHWTKQKKYKLESE